MTASEHLLLNLLNFVGSTVIENELTVMMLTAF